MKSGFFAAIVLCSLLFLAPAAHSSVLLVSDSSGSTHADVRKVSATGLQPLSRVILRQRIAQLSPDKLLRRSSVNSIQLQLFDNLHLTALQKQDVRGPDGFLMWTGAIEGVEGGRLVLVVRDGLLFGSVYLPSSIIQIRPVSVMAGSGETSVAEESQPFQGASDPRDYIIREIAYPSGTGGMDTGTGATSDARRLLELVNLEREADGLQTLEYSDQLAEAARRHATDMASHNYFAHELSDGEQFWQNVFDCGYPVSVVGENLAAGVSTPAEAFECLFSSPGHRANIMNSTFTQTGVGDAENGATAYRYYWAQEFGAASANSAQSVRLSADRAPL